MIQLRWVERTVLADTEPQWKYERVLQFRQQELTFPALTVLEFQEGNRWQWTDWQDVPVVPA